MSQSQDEFPDDFPSDFDPNTYYVPEPDQIPDSDDFPLPLHDQNGPCLPSESHSDEIEAIYLQKEENRERWDKEGIVIRHRAKDHQRVFRTSSPVPGTPTPAAKLSERIKSSSFFLPAENSSPIRDSQKSSAPGRPDLRSSPPPMDYEPAAKKQKISFASQISDVLEEEEQDAQIPPDWSQRSSESNSQKDTQPTGLATPSDDETPRQPCKPFVPNFNIPLTGGLFSKTKFAPLSLGKKLTDKPTDKSVDNTPPLRFPSPEPVPVTSTAPQARLPSLTPPPKFSSLQQSTSSIESVTTSITDEGTSISVTAISDSSTDFVSKYKKISVFTSAGEEIRVTQKPARAYNGVRNTLLSATEETSAGSTRKYFGIDIQSLTDGCALEKQELKAKAASMQDLPIAGSGDTTRKKPLLWTEKYRAKKFTDLIGDERTHRHVMHWMKEWDSIVFPGQSKPAKKHQAKATEEGREKKKILILHGPPGLGKTTLAHVAARQAGYEAYEINASDDRSGGVVKGKIKDVLTNEGVKSCGLKSGKKQSNGRPICLVIDEIDGVTGGGNGGGNEAGFVKALVDLILEDQRASKPQPSTNTKRRSKKKDLFKLQRPIIAVCNDLYAPALKALRPLAEIVQMRKPPLNLMAERLRWIFEKEGFAIEEGAVRKLVDLSTMGSGGGNKGDMRGAMVCGEWIATRMKRENPSISKKGKGKQLLTRKIVEEEFGNGAIGAGDGKTSGGGRMGVREAVDSVFYIEKEAPSRKKITNKRSTHMKVQEVVEGCGEFEKIMTDCFATYPTRHFHDDSMLSKPNAAYDWLYFSDLCCSRVFHDQTYELTPYLCQPIVAFHHIFASSTAKRQQHTLDPEETEPTPFSGPNAEWQAYEAEKEHSTLIQSIHSSISSIRLAQTFKAPAVIATELAPFLDRILSPRVNPVIVGGSGTSVSSVRREAERKLVQHAVGAMEATGVCFERVRVDPTPGANAAGGWAYRMTPAVDALGMYQTLDCGEKEGVRFAVRQVLAQELKKSELVREKEARERRMGQVLAKEVMPVPVEDMKGKKRKIGKVKRDFFGRLVVEVEGEKEGQEDERKKRRKKNIERDDTEEIYVRFHEGFSNAVRKGIGLEELMAGFY